MEFRDCEHGNEFSVHIYRIYIITYAFGFCKGQSPSQLPSTLTSSSVPLFQPHAVNLTTPMMPTTLSTTTPTNTNKLSPQIGSLQPVQPLGDLSSSSHKSAPVTPDVKIQQQQQHMTPLYSKESIPAPSPMGTPLFIPLSSIANSQQPYGLVAQPNLNASQQDNVSQNFNISPFAGTQTNSNNSNETSMSASTKVVPHWFFVKTSVQYMPFYKTSTQWTPFSVIDSRNLEHEFLKMKMKPSGVVRTHGGRYDVDLTKMQMQSVYWIEAPSEVRRCTWFLKEENQFVPYTVSVADKLEVIYAVKL